MTLRERFWNHARYLLDALAFRWMIWRRFRSWRDRPREERRYRQRMEQWTRRNRFMPIGPVKRSTATAADTRDALRYHNNVSR